MHTKHHQRGFTLVEIMIVVGIISLLATIAIPNFLKSRNRSQTNACINNLRQINGAVETWALENNKASAAPVTWADIAVYIKTEPFCPSGGTSFADSYAITIASEKATCLKIPANHVISP